MIKLTLNGPEMEPGAAATQTHGAIAAKGGGKSYLAGVFAEQLAVANVPFIVIDPIGNWCFLRLAADGKSAGIDVAVIGGERGDVPLHHDQGAALGRFLVEHNGSAVLDVSEFSKTKRKEFVADFCEALYRTARLHRSPRMVIFEEAQVFAPQHPNRGEERMLGAVTDIVRLGRNYGIGPMLVTQRPQSVSKEVLNQIECLFVGGLRGPHERKAIAGWVTEQGADTVRAELEKLPTLQPGEFFQWSPSWLKWFGRVKVAKKVTYDGSSTPTLNNGGGLPVRFEPVDLEDLRALLEPPGEPELGATVRTPRDDNAVTALQDRVDALTADLEEARDRVDALDEANAHLLSRALRAERGEAEAVRRFDSLRETVRSAIGTIGDVCEALKNEAMPDLDVPATVDGEAQAVIPDRKTGRGVPAQALGRMPGERERKRQPAAAPTVARSSPSTDAGSSEYSDEVLAVIAAYGPVTRNQLSILSGKSKASSTFANALRVLIGLADITDSGGFLEATARGKKRAPAPRLTRGRQVLEHHITALGDYDAATFRALLPNKRTGIARKTIAELTGHSIASSTFAGSIRRLKKLGLADEVGGMVRPVRRRSGSDGPVRQYNPNPRHPKKTAAEPVSTNVIFVPSPQVMQALTDLVATGLFGTTTDECAYLLLRERLREVELRFNLPRRVRRGKK